MKLAPLFVLLIANALGTCAFAADLPTGGRVATGTAGIATGANSLVITQGSNRAIINWSSFSVGAGNTVQFVQPSASSAVLNRVVASNPSLIYGSITANGQVFLVNPSGIYVGPGGTIQAAGIFLSTGNISNADFLADNIRFEPATADTPIVISGRLDASDRIGIGASTIDCSNCTLNAPTIFMSDSLVTQLPALTSLGSLAPSLPATLPELSSASGAGSVTISTTSIALNEPSGVSGSLSLTGTTPVAVTGTQSFAGTLSIGTGGTITLTNASAAPGSTSLGHGSIAIAGSSSGGSLSLTSGKLAVPADARKLLQRTAGSIALRGAPSIQASAPTPSPASTPPALRASAPAARLVNTGGLVDGAVTVRLSLVDAAPISLR